MTILHLLSTLAFVLIGGAGLSAIQAGLFECFRQLSPRGGIANAHRAKLDVSTKRAQTN